MTAGMTWAREEVQRTKARMPTKIFFVCTANMFRSPTAHYLFRHMTSGLYEIRSGGIAISSTPDWLNTGMLKEPRDVLTFHHEEIGQSAHKTSPVTLADVDWADLVVCMEEKHKAWIMAEYGPQYHVKIRLMPIPDTTGNGHNYHAAYGEIRQACMVLKTRIETSS